MFFAVLLASSAYGQDPGVTDREETSVSCAELFADRIDHLDSAFTLSSLQTGFDPVVVWKGEGYAYTQINCDFVIELVEIQSLKNDAQYREFFGLLNGELMYASESILYYYLKEEGTGLEQAGWTVWYAIKGKKVLHHSSNGHGETELDEWVPESIIDQWLARKQQLVDLNIISDSKQ